MQITEDADAGTITINGQVIDGFLWSKPCRSCGGVTVYHEKYDAAFCPACNLWLESQCSDSFCSYCRGRPRTPLK
jgi:hypothetical protein